MICHKTFIWDSEANAKAHVHCVIIGFSSININTKKIIYDSEKINYPKNINPYLIDAPTVFIYSRKNRILEKVPNMIAPNKPCDYNFLKLEENEYKEFIEKDPKTEKWIKRMVGAQEFIKNKKRYCLWLVGCSPKEIKEMPLIMDRVKKCKEARINANTKESLKLSETPTLFREQINPDKYLIIPCVSSENRRYIPMGFWIKIQFLLWEH